MKTTAIALALGLALAVTGCSKKSDDVASTAPANAAPAAARCPAGSGSDGTNCKATGQGRVARLTWNGTFGDTAQVLTLRNTSGMSLKAGSVTVWFYDRTGKRLDVAGAKKYALPGDAFGSTIKVGETRTITFPLSKTGVPDGTAMMEGEVVKATLVNADGTDGPGWKNDDLNSDDRAMLAAPAPAPGAVATAVRPGVKPPPPPPPHR
ncbi:MAG TPA: hypothetical protein VHS09_02385 [Polyangiaceae bacterium]|jgi:hypothetical protein|nr:hypothetical protein [Polyangiaceae bacterium]